jgi:hypothetical protein
MQNACIILNDKGSNYQLWAKDAKMRLVSQGLWDTSLPKAGSLPGLAVIYSSVSDFNKLYIVDLECPKTAWESLVKKYASESLALKVTSIWNLTQKSLSSDHAELRAQLVEQKNIYRDLLSANGGKKEISLDELLCLFTLVALPDSLGTVRTVIEMSVKEKGATLAFSDIEDKILSAAKSLENSTSSSAALSTRMKMESQQTKPGMFCKKHNRFKGPCYLCDPSKIPEGHLCEPCKKAGKGYFHVPGSIRCQSKSSAALAFTIDSGATDHMTNNKAIINAYSSSSSSIRVADGSYIVSTGSGSVDLDTPEATVRLSRVLHVPSLSENLLSISKLTGKGLHVVFTGSSCYVVSNGFQWQGTTVLTGGLQSGLYRIRLPAQASVADSTPQECLTYDEWHLKLAHLSKSGIDNLAKSGQIQLDKTSSLSDCTFCTLAKTTRASFQGPGLVASRVGDIIVSDVCGPLETSLSSHRYFVTFVDVYSRFVTVSPLRNKSGESVFQAFKEYAMRLFNRTGRHVTTLHTDNGGEFKNQRFHEFCLNHGIHQQFTIPYTPEQNGISERMNLTLLNPVRAMLKQANLPDSLWDEAIQVAAYTRNCCSTAALETDKTPHDLFYSKAPPYDGLQVFGSSCYVRASPTSKLSDRAVQSIFVGYCLNARGYRLLDPINLSIQLSRSEDVSFPETPVFIGLSRLQLPSQHAPRVFPGQVDSLLSHDLPLAISGDAPLLPSSGSDPAVSSSGSNPVISSSGSDPIVSSESNSQDDSENDRSSDGSFHEAMATPEEIQVALNEDSVTFGNGRFPRRARRTPAVAFLTSVHHSLPKSFQDIRGRPDADEWYKACDQEIMSLHKHGTWTLVNSTPTQSQTLGSLWVFRIKYYADGSIAKYKS